MSSSSYSAVPRRQNGHYPNRLSLSNGNGLPQYSNSSAVQEKLHLQGHSPPWIMPVYLRLPFLPSRALRLWAPNPRRLHHFSIIRFGGRKRGATVLCFVFALIIFVTFALAKRFGTEEKTWPRAPFTDPATLVYKREDLQRIWKWEVASGHYPSRYTSM